MILGVAVVLACLAGMTWWATNMVLKNEDLQAYIKKMEASQEDSNATIVKPSKNISNAAETTDQQDYEEEKED